METLSTGYAAASGIGQPLALRSHSVVLGWFFSALVRLWTTRSFVRTYFHSYYSWSWSRTSNWLPVIRDHKWILFAIMGILCRGFCHNLLIVQFGTIRATIECSLMVIWPCVLRSCCTLGFWSVCFMCIDKFVSVCIYTFVNIRRVNFVD